MELKKLQNGSDIRGVAVDGVKEKMLLLQKKLFMLWQEDL